jgi:hypothetical protein
MVDISTGDLADPAYSAAERIALRRQVLDWRDYWSIEAEVRLRTVLAERSPAIDTQIKSLSVTGLALARTGRRPIPAVANLVEAIEQVARDIVAEAEASLNAIVAHSLAITAEAATVGHLADFSARQLRGLGQTVAPLAAAVGLGIALPGLATTTSVALFGLVTSTTVSASILIAGIGGVAALSALGVINFSGLRADQERRLSETVAAGLEKGHFVPVTHGREPSMLAKLEAGFAQAANQLTGERW